MFESTALEYQRAKIARNDARRVDLNDVPFGTLRELFNSASMGDCHFCCSLAARVSVSESAHLIMSRDMKPDEQVRPSLQPVVSQGVFLGIELKTAIDTSIAGSDKTLWHSRVHKTDECSEHEWLTLHLKLVKDGKLVELTRTSWNGRPKLPHPERTCKSFLISILRGSYLTLWSSFFSSSDSCFTNQSTHGERSKLESSAPVG